MGPWVSVLPRMAVTGAMRERVVRISGSPTSPAWRMWETLARAGRSFGAEEAVGVGEDADEHREVGSDE